MAVTNVKKKENGFKDKLARNWLLDSRRVKEEIVDDIMRELTEEKQVDMSDDLVILETPKGEEIVPRRRQQ